MFREHYMKVISDKHDDVMAKFGAILAHGILDAGSSLFRCFCAVYNRFSLVFQAVVMSLYLY